MNTEIENKEYFNLPTLLKLDALNVRHFATTEPSLSVNGYFEILSNFLKLAPSVSSALVKFTALDADRDAYKKLSSAIDLLGSFGCNKFILDFHSILNAYGKKGNWREAAVYAKQIRENFDAFCSEIMAAKNIKKSTTLPDALNSSVSSFIENDMPLEEFIKHLDDIEANRKLLILAVDDSPIILKAVSSILSDTYKVFMLPKPQELKNVLRKLTPELFLLDYQMPGLNGFEIIPIIRSFKEHEETPIIFLTSVRTIDNISTAFALGACDFIVKPFKPNILREKIAKHIVRKKTF
jgi:CheY-like chemotaxis protein